MLKDIDRSRSQVPHGNTNVEHENPLQSTENLVEISVGNLLEMERAIVSKVEKLPPIPKTVLEIEKLKNAPDIDNEKLLKIIEGDNILTAHILRIANSALYGFGGKIKTPRMAMSLLGFNIACNIAISCAINKVLDPNLSPYEVSLDEFIHISSLQSRIFDKWNDPKLKSLKSDLQIAAFLQEVGKIIISKIIIDKKLVYNFQRRLEEGEDISLLEEKTIHKSSAEITAMIFKHWKLNPKMTNLILYSDKPETAPDDLKLGAMALKIVKTLSPVFRESFGEKDFAKALKLAKEYGFDTSYLETVIASFERL